MSRICSQSLRIPCVCSALVALILAAWPGYARAQLPDETRVAELARLLAASDARAYDDAVFADAFEHRDPAVRRQAALAAGRIGDGAALEGLERLLSDTAATVRAAAAFALGMLKDARAVPVLVQFIG